MHSPSRRRRREARSDLIIATVVLALVAVAAIAGLWLAGKTAAIGPFACTGYEFERSEWRGSGTKERREEARLMTRCDHLVGKTRRQVRADLGDPEGGPGGERRWRFFIGSSSDYLRIGDSGHLIVRFNGSGRVVRAELPEQEN